MKKIVKYSIAAGAGLLALGTLAACNNEGVKYKDYDVTVDGASYKFKIYDESMEEVNETTTTTSAEATGTDTTTSTTEEDRADEAAKSTEGRQVVLSKLVSSSENVSVPSVVTINNLTYTVTRIGAGAFVGMSDVKTIVVPVTVSQIFDRAFEYCSGLQSITYNGEITKVGSALYTGSSVTKITYKGETLLNGLASGIKTLQTLELPNVVTLGEKSIYFSAESYLETITFGDGKLTTIQKNAISNVSRPIVEAWSGTSWVKTNVMGKKSVDGTYYTLDENGITYTKYNATVNNSPEPGVQYYKATGETGTVETINGSAASVLTVNEKNESTLTNTAKAVINAISTNSEVNFAG